MFKIGDRVRMIKGGSRTPGVSSHHPGLEEKEGIIRGKFPVRDNRHIYSVEYGAELNGRDLGLHNCNNACPSGNGRNIEGVLLELCRPWTEFEQDLYSYIRSEQDHAV